MPDPNKNNHRLGRGKKATSSTYMNLRRWKIKGKTEDRISIFQFKVLGVREI